MSTDPPQPSAARTDRERKATTLRVQILLLSIPLVVAAGVLIWAHSRSGSPLWLWIGALVPAFLVMQHGVSLYLFRPTFFWRETPPPVNRAGQPADLPHQTTPSDTAADDPANTNPPAAPSAGARDTAAVRIRSLHQARVEAEQQFGLWSISLDYFVPTLLNVVAGLTMTYFAFIAFTHPGFFLSDDAQDGVILGALGAFVYVLMSLGTRTFQRDITPGSAVWSAIQLFLGPILGGVTARILGDSAQLNQFTRQAFYFFAGLAPRQIVTTIQTTVERFFAGQSPPPVTRLIPLQSIRGITREIEERLREEGITDGYLLAMANPIRLRRNTPYDERQLLAWIDESLLHSFVPEFAPLLQKEGVSGAIDLAYYWEMGPGGQPALDRIAILAELVHARAEMLGDVVRRLNEDAQVQLIWSLYQSTGDGEA